jgi:beta-glucosidase
MLFFLVADFPPPNETRMVYAGSSRGISMGSTQHTGSDFPFRNPELPLAVRINDLLSRLTLSEKVAQMLHEAPGLEKLGIAPYSWWNEALHGVARAGSATIFPQAIGLGATFDRELAHRVASAISDEARAKYEVFSEKGTAGRYVGLTFWTPNINIFRDPRWGRGQETYGEDPYLTGEIGAQFVSGLQGDDPAYLKTAACAKHFAVHSGPEKLRHEFNAIASPYDLEDTYLPAFRKLVVEAQVESVMGAYNRTNGEPCCGSEFLLEKTLRGDWGFQGHVTSDCWALQDFHQGHKVTAGPVESAALAVNRGCDLNCGNLFHHLEDAVKMGFVSVETINQSLRRLFSTRFRLGEFDPKAKVAYRSIPRSVIRSQDHLDLSYETAVRSMVLLKNDGTLPLDKNKLKSLYLTGPNALAPEALLGNYHGLSPRLVTFVEGITEEADQELKVEFRHGALLAEESKIPTDWASFEAAGFDVTIACMGLNILLEGEEGDAIATPTYGDRASIALPKGQHEFLMKVLNQGKPVVLVVSAGSAIDLSPYVEKAAAIVYTWYPGELGGTALAHLLFGKRDFSGKLPVTLPRRLEDLPPFEDYDMSNRTYRYSSADPLFPYGFGLNYRPLKVTSIACPSTVGPRQSLTVTVKVTNPHRVAAAEVVQLYLRKETGLKAARFELAGFERLELQAGETKTLTLTVSERQIASVHQDGTRAFTRGKLILWAGTGQPDSRSHELGVEVCKTELTLAP